MVLKPQAIHEVPGVHYNPQDNRARIEGTRVEPWLVLMSFENAKGDWAILREAFDWLSEAQLRAAMAFAEANPEFVRERIEEERNLNLEALWRDIPQTKPPHLR